MPVPPRARNAQRMSRTQRRSLRHRRPPENPRMSLTIGVDVGGTKIAAGAVDERGIILEKLRRPTPSASPERTAMVIAETVTGLLRRHKAEAVGVGAAGFVDETRS